LKTLEQKALAYHASGQRGKIAIQVTKSVANSEELALAYSPGVAAPCMAIRADPSKAYEYTAKGNLVSAAFDSGVALVQLDEAAYARQLESMAAALI
jgi:malate dehydrogenase (oxaloacetate-decarboxylating)(NADP+)